MSEIKFTDAEIKEDLWALNDFQDRILEEEKQALAQMDRKLNIETIFAGVDEAANKRTHGSSSDQGTSEAQPKL